MPPNSAVVCTQEERERERGRERKLERERKRERERGGRDEFCKREKDS
jgi:hypothetical protein